MSETNTCKTCRFMRQEIDYSGVVRAAYMGIKREPFKRPFCHLQPVPLRVDDDHWCGQHKPLDTASGPA